MMRPGISISALSVAVLFSGCTGIQSSLDPQGEEATKVAQLFWIMTAGAAVILFGLCVLIVFSIWGGVKWRERIASERLIVAGGIIFPVVVLSALLGYGLVLTSKSPAAPAPGDQHLTIRVTGHQWWWRVKYFSAGAWIESANEIRLPVDQPVVLELTSADVIHSLWIPKLAGKLDMIPGKTTRLTVRATEAGVSRAQCAEYCGGAHALMSLFVVAMEAREFETWLEREAAPVQPDVEKTAAGQALFLKTGCGACHAVRGTSATGRIGPDLTHLGSRRSLAAATLPNNAEAIARWIRDNQHIKPENKMPPYAIFSAEELAGIAAYLARLK